MLCARLFSTVHGSNHLDTLWKSSQESINRERPVKTHFHHSYLITLLSVEIVDGLAHHISTRTHYHDDTVSIRRPMIVHKMILASCN